jgi:hypothetical protein
MAYKFYLRDPVKGNELIGVLPERRKDPSRIIQQSVMHWIEENVFCNGLNSKDIYFVQETINEDTGNIFRPTPLFITQQKVKK